MIRRRPSVGVGTGAVMLVLLLLLPPVVGSTQLSLPTEIFLFAVFALTYDVLFGFTGLISFGHALFVGFGGYSIAVAMTGHGVAFWPALLIVLVTGLVVSTVTGVVALRTRGVYFAMVTLAFAQAAFTLAQSNIGNQTNGENGLTVSGAPNWLVGPTSQTHFYYVALAVLVCSFLLLRVFVQSPVGASLAGNSRKRAALPHAGVPTVRVQTAGLRDLRYAGHPGGRTVRPLRGRGLDQPVLGRCHDLSSS